MAKIKMETDDDKFECSSAKDFLLATKAIDQCEYHDEIFIDNLDEEAVEKAISKAKRAYSKSIHLQGAYGSVEELIDEIKLLMKEETYDKCPRCAKLKAK